jgi:hypothetical protein
MLQFQTTIFIFLQDKIKPQRGKEHRERTINVFSPCAILGVLRGGLVNVLITDEAAAVGVLQLSRE